MTMRSFVVGSKAAQEAAVVADAGVDGALACGAVVPPTYESTGFATNAAVEIAFGQRFNDIAGKMQAVEDGSDAGVTSADLKATYNAGAPSLRSVSTTENPGGARW